MKNKFKIALTFVVAAGLASHNLNSTAAHEETIEAEKVKLELVEQGNNLFAIKITIMKGATTEEIVKSLKEAVEAPANQRAKINVELHHWNNNTKPFYEAARQHPELAAQIDSLTPPWSNVNIRPEIRFFTKLTELRGWVDDETVPEGVGKLPNLQSLTLGGKKLQFLPETLRKKICSRKSKFKLYIYSSDATYCDATRYTHKPNDVRADYRIVHMIKFENGIPGMIACEAEIRDIDVDDPDAEVAKNLTTSANVGANPVMVKAATQHMIRTIVRKYICDRSRGYQLLPYANSQWATAYISPQNTSTACCSLM
ncbi:hypothetical protein HOD08_02860 [bacterium]|nr:hypothetical protein [bacterium]